MKSIHKGEIPEALYQSVVVLYGAGITGNRIVALLKPYKVRILYIIDDDKNKWGSTIDGIPIISYRVFEEKCTGFAHVSVILTTIYGKAVLKKLRQITWADAVEVYEMYGWLNEAYQLNGLIGGVDDAERIERFHGEIGSLKVGLADEESKRVLDGIDRYLYNKDLNILADICTESDQYFIPEVLSAIRKPLNILDAGAYVGELYQTIRNHDIKLEHWYCFEANADNYNKLIQYSQNMELSGIQVCVNKGLWDQDGTLYFDSSKGTASRIVDYRTDDQIEVISIDTYFRDKKCDFIKMDIEGAEYPALCGAMDVIRRERPIMAVSIYHSIEDLYRIQRFLMDRLQGYRYYIRHHALILCETVLYVVPNEL